MCKEGNLNTLYTTQISDHWQQGTFSSFEGVDLVDIHYCSFVFPQHSRSIIIVPGRSEGYLKYKELTYDLHLAGYNVFIIDHRGQGLSGRMLEDKLKGYVQHFDDYVLDLHYFIENIVQPKIEHSPYLLAHSMGGAISTRFLQSHENSIKAAVLASPMIEINSGAMPKWFVSILMKIALKFFKHESYFFGQSGKHSFKYKDNRLTHSNVRYKIFAQLYEQTPTLKLGGATIQWLKSAIDVGQDIIRDVKKLNTPTMVLQACGDKVVDNNAQNRFCELLNSVNKSSCPGGKPFRIETAKHELFFESDEYRDKALTQAVNWFEQH